MGNFEKLVVLVVLFLVAVVLAVSSGDGNEVEAGDHPAVAGRSETGVTPVAQPLPEREQPRKQTTPVRANPSKAKTSPPKTAPSSSDTRSLLLDASPAAEAPKTEVLPDGRRKLLRSEAGLRPSFLSEFREYTVRDGDTWSGLAQRFYRDARQVSVLQTVNEGLERLTEGREILVPVYDLESEADERANFQPLRRPEPRRDATPTTAPTQETSTPATAPRLAGTSNVRPGGRYTVVDGDSLSKISLKVYGVAHRWEEIYEANKDVMKSADWLSIGMELYIPRAGEVTVPERAPEPEPVATGGSGRVH